MTNPKESDLQPPFFVLYCPDDDSHALVGETSLLYDDEVLSLEDKVKFFYPGHKSPLDGIIKGKSENYNEMVALQDKLNRASKPKRQQSFSPSRPRKAAVKCMEGLNIKHQPRSSAAKAGTSSKLVQQPEMPMDRSNSPKGANIYSDSDSCKSDNGISKPESHNEQLTDENDSLSSDSSAFSPEEQALALKLERKKAAKELKALRALSSRGNKNHVDEKTNNEEKGDKKTESKKKVDIGKKDKKNESERNVDSEKKDKKNESERNVDSKKKDKKNESERNVDSEKKDKKNESERNVDSDKLSNNDKKNEAETEDDSEKKNDKKTNEESSSSDDVKMKAPPAKKRKILKKVPTNHLLFEGQHFRWQKTDEKVELLHSSYDVYVKAKELKRLKSKAVTGTALARGALRLVFTDDALANCSVSGKPAPGRNGVRETRTALDRDGIEAILDFVKARLAKHKLQCSESSLKQAMANLLCEKRAEVPTEDLLDKGNKADQDSHDN